MKTDGLDKRRGIRYNKFMTKKRTLLLFAFGIGACILTLAAMLLLRRIPTVAEWWSTHVSAAYVALAGRITAIVPVSLFELLVIAVVVWGVSLVAMGIVFLVRKRYFGVLCGALSVCLAVLFVLNVYTATAGFAYYRPRLALPMSGNEQSEEFVFAAADHYYDDYVALAERFPRDEKGNVIPPYSLRELSRKLTEAYDKADIAYLYRYTPRGKGMANSWLLSWLRLTGITFLPTAEPNVNKAMPASEIPQTMAHEMAHAKGVMREGDANLVAYYVLINSDDDYLRYCGYFSCFGNIQNAVRITTDDEAIYEKYRLPAVIGTEIGNTYAYWSRQPDIIGKISEFFNNLYLKLNGAGNGTGSYGDATDSDIVDTGEKDEEDKPIYKPVYSTLQRVLFYLYAQKTA